MRVLVCGGRAYRDFNHVYRVLDELHSETPITWLIHGGATGADTLAADWGRSRLGHNLLDPYPADWNDTRHPNALIRYRNGRPYNAKAGFWRNTRMLKQGCPDVVIAFPGGPGTGDMIAQARKAGIEVREMTTDMDEVA